MVLAAGARGWRGSPSRPPSPLPQAAVPAPAAVVAVSKTGRMLWAESEGHLGVLVMVQRPQQGHPRVERQQRWRRRWWFELHRLVRRVGV